MNDMLAKLKNWWFTTSIYERAVALSVPAFAAGFALYTWASNPSAQASNRMLGRMRDEMMQLISRVDPVRSRNEGSDYGGAYVVWTVTSTKDFDAKFVNPNLFLESSGWQKKTEVMTWCKNEVLLKLDKDHPKEAQHSYYLFGMTYDLSTIRRCS